MYSCTRVVPSSCHARSLARPTRPSRRSRRWIALHELQRLRRAGETRRAAARTAGNETPQCSYRCTPSARAGHTSWHMRISRANAPTHASATAAAAWHTLARAQACRTCPSGRRELPIACEAKQRVCACGRLTGHVRQNLVETRCVWLPTGTPPAGTGTKPAHEVRMRTLTHAHATHTHAHARTYTRTRARSHMHARIHTRTQTPTRAHTQPHAHTHTHARARTHAHTRSRTRTRARSSVQTYAHTHTHTRARASAYTTARTRTHAYGTRTHAFRARAHAQTERTDDVTTGRRRSLGLMQAACNQRTTCRC